MRLFTQLPLNERNLLISNTAESLGLSDGIVEKDFWVCYTLDHLFHFNPWQKQFAFKGGTSLSKCFGLISRFSEDIDLILDWRVLGFTADDLWKKRSKTKQDLFNKEVNAATAVFLRETFLPQLQIEFSGLLKEDFSLWIDGADPQTVHFAYPRVFTNEVIISEIRLEIGALAAWTPTQAANVTSFVAQKYPNIFKKPSTMILTTSPERTFWEKVTILHKEAYRTTGSIPSRYSRHYYDLYCMGRSDVKKAAYDNLDLLEQVVRFKDRFYPSGSAHYDTAKPPTLKLTPAGDSIAILRRDYESMKSMIFGAPPSFDELMTSLQLMESEMNRL